MSIPFKQIPKSRIPFIYVEFDNEKAQRHDFDLIYRVLLIGEQTGKAEMYKPYPLKTAKETQDLFGAGSMLHQMAQCFFTNASNSNLYGVAIPEGGRDLKALFEKIKDSQFHLIVNPYLEAISGLQVDLEERFSAKRQLEVHVVTAVQGDVKEVLEKKKGLTSPHVTLISAGKNSSTPDYVWAAATAGVMASYGQDDPAAPMKSCPLHGVLPDPEEERFTRSEREALLREGVSTWYTLASGTPRIELLVTTYKNELNEVDESYLYTNTLLVCMAIRHSFVSYFGSKYARAKLADDGAFFPSGVQTLTPKIGKSEAVNLFKSWMDKGWVTGLDEFKNSLIVERNQEGPTRIDFYLEPKFISQLNVMGAKISFLF